MEPIISFKNVSKSFTVSRGRRLPVLEDIILDIYPGEFFVFVGPSGCGKSTLLRIASGLETVYDGSVKLGIGMSSSDVSFVFQQFALLPWLTVAENIEIGLIGRKVPSVKRKLVVARELKQFGLEKFSVTYPRDLSGGMRQRVGIARALAINPKIIFMDEPFSELDSFTAEKLRQELLDIWQERQVTIIMVTHIIEEALELADRIAVIAPRPGKIEQVVANNLSRPRQKRSTAFYELEDYIYRLIRF